MKSRYTEIFIYLVMLYISSILIANVAAFKLVKIFSLTLTAGTLVFPISYILGDVFSEIYGFKVTKKIIIGGFICNALMVLIFAIAIKLPYPNYFHDQEAFSLVLGNTPRLFIASILAYLIGGLSNSYIMQFIKNNSKIKYLWFRTIFSTIIGEALDSIVFLVIAFVGDINFDNILFMILCQSTIKILFEIIMTPITYKIINILKEKEFNR